MDRPLILTVVLATALAASIGSSGRAMTLSSTSMANGASLSLDQVKSGCGGKNISPALSWTGAPPEAKSFAVTMFDPDAHGGWWHWVVIGIPEGTQSLPAGAGNGSGLPAGAIQIQNDFGDASYGGACPPPGSGAHHYETTLWALPEQSPPFDANAKAGDVARYVKTHAIAHSEIVSIYER